MVRGPTRPTRSRVPRAPPSPRRAPWRCAADHRTSARGPPRARRRPATPRIAPARTPPATRRTGGSGRTTAPAGRSGRTTADERGASGDGIRRTPAGRNRRTRAGRDTADTRRGGGAARPPQAPRARLTAARITSSGAVSSGKKRLNATAPWCTRTSRPSCARTPAAVSVRTHRVPPGAYTRSSAACNRAALSGSSGSGSVSFKPAGVALMAISGSSVPRAAAARVPCWRAQSAKSRARPASRDSTCRSAFAAAAATATARAAPPVPTRSQLPAPSAPSWRRAARIPATSVLSPTSAPCSVQNVLHAPTRAHTSVFRETHRSAASLCGTVTFPAPPTAASAASTVTSAGVGVRNATYTASSPRTPIAALCMEGESEWATGSPITASRRVLALTSTRELFGDAIHGRLEERLELDTRVAIHVEVTAEGVAHLGLVALAAGVLSQHEHMTLAAQLVHARPVVPRHGQDEVGVVDELARQEPRPVARQIEPALEAHEVGSLGDRRTIPGPGAGRGDCDSLDRALHQGTIEQRRRERAAADVSGANEQDAFRVRFLGHGASRPAARRNSPSVSAPSRISRGAGRVQ